MNACNPRSCTNAHPLQEQVQNGYRPLFFQRMSPKGLGSGFRKSQTAIFTALSLNTGFPIFPKPFDGSMGAFRACHVRPLALQAREADNRRGLGSCDLNSHGLGWPEPAVRAAGQAFSNKAHHGPVLFPCQGRKDWPFVLWPLMSVGNGSWGLKTLLIASPSLLKTVQLFLDSKSYLDHLDKTFHVFNGWVFFNIYCPGFSNSDGNGNAHHTRWDHISW